MYELTFNSIVLARLTDGAIAAIVVVVVVVSALIIFILGVGLIAYFVKRRKGKG